MSDQIQKLIDTIQSECAAIPIVAVDIFKGLLKIHISVLLSFLIDGAKKVTRWFFIFFLRGPDSHMVEDLCLKQYADDHSFQHHGDGKLDSAGTGKEQETFSVDETQRPALIQN